MHQTRRTFLCSLGVTGSAFVLLPGCGTTTYLGVGTVHPDALSGDANAADGNASDGTDASSSSFVFHLSDAAFADLQTVGGMVALDLTALKLLLIRTADDHVTAFSRLCPHAEADLGPAQEGSYSAATNTLTCNLHNSKFDGAGACTSGPAMGKSLKSYPVTFNAGTGVGQILLK